MVICLIKVQDFGGRVADWIVDTLETALTTRASRVPKIVIFFSYIVAKSDILS